VTLIGAKIFQGLLQLVELGFANLSLEDRPLIPE
jgi:hypothetical protein